MEKTKNTVINEMIDFLEENFDTTDIYKYNDILSEQAMFFKKIIDHKEFKQGRISIYLGDTYGSALAIFLKYLIDSKIYIKKTKYIDDEHQQSFLVYLCDSERPAYAIEEDKESGDVNIVYFYRSHKRYAKKAFRYKTIRFNRIY